MAASNKEIVKQVNETYTSNDTGAFLSFCTDDVKLTMTGTPSVTGKEKVREFMNKMKPEGPVQLTISDMIAEGDKVAVQGTIKMTMEGKPFEGTYCDVYRFDNGKIKELTSYVVEDKAENK
jgi:ketosteroid isomerase-like protein